MAHLTFKSLRPGLRTLPTWKVVSSWSIAISGLVALGIGASVYATFWEQAESDMFALYPAWPIIDVGKLLVCFMMLLTYPLPLFTCREMVIVAATTKWSSLVGASYEPEQEDSLEEPLLAEDENEESGLPPPTDEVDTRPSWMISETQLSLPYHCLVTILFWGITTVLAILAPSLGAVLDLVGCATGTVIAFVLPGAFSFKEKGYTHEAAMILVVGGVVGLIGTYFSVKNIIEEY